MYQKTSTPKKHRCQASSRSDFDAFMSCFVSNSCFFFIYEKKAGDLNRSFTKIEIQQTRFYFVD